MIFIESRGGIPHGSEKVLQFEECACVCVSLFLCDGRGNVAPFSAACAVSRNAFAGQRCQLVLLEKTKRPVWGLMVLGTPTPTAAKSGKDNPTAWAASPAALAMSATTVSKGRVAPVGMVRLVTILYCSSTTPALMSVPPRSMASRYSMQPSPVRRLRGAGYRPQSPWLAGCPPDPDVR